MSVYKITKSRSGFNHSYEDKTFPLVEPLIYEPTIKDSYREIIYPIKAYDNYKERIKKLTYIDHNKYRYTSVFNEINYNAPPYGITDSAQCAFGLLINPYHTKLAVIDIDNTNVSTGLLEKSFINDAVFGIDVMASNYVKKSYHIYIGLKEYTNINSIYESPKEFMCKGFCYNVSHSGSLVIRTSPKFDFTSTIPNTKIRFIRAIRNIDGVWYRFGAYDVKVPDVEKENIDNDIVYKKENLNLRKKYVSKEKETDFGSISQAKREISATISSSEDTSDFPLPF